jgi:hypothetical protein
MQRFFLLAALVCCTFVGSLTAQTASASYVPSSSNSALADNDWTLYADADNQLYYIDFEKLRVNLNAIVLRDEQGNLVLEDQVFDLPVNTIYELDFSKLPSGKYFLELRSFNGIIRETIDFKRG